jgi:hypothetical protein
MRRILSLAALLFLSTRLDAGYVLVTNVNDSGPGSLRQAILDLPGCARPCLVAFDIAGTSPTGYWTIEPLSPLPGIWGLGGVTIDGNTQRMGHGDTNPYGPEIVLSGASAGPAVGLDIRVHDYTVRGLGFENWYYAAVSTTGSLGLYFEPVRIRGITIADNYFGVDARGQNPAPNGSAMNLSIVQDVTVSNNVISGNARGIAVTVGLRVNISKNNIGLDAARTTTLGNTTTGIRLNGVQEALVERNVIAGHQTAVAVDSSASRGNAIHRNQMFGNVFGIDLNSDGPTPNDNADADAGPNGYQNHPLLKMSGRTLRGTLSSTPNTDFDVDIYETDQPGNNQGRRYIGTVTVLTDHKGSASFSFIVPNGAGPYFTATAMGDVERSTSEFCDPVG